MGWQPIETSPFGEVVEVKNELMTDVVLATRGHGNNPDYFTSVYTPARYTPNNLWSYAAGKMVVPTVWRHKQETKE